MIPKTPTGNTDWEKLLQQCPFLQALPACPQEPEHHGEGDVLTHTKLVTGVGEDLARSHGLSPQESEDLLWGCTLHDIGKPITLAKEEDGKWSSRKHALKGAAFLQFLLWENGSSWNLERREKILGLIRLHAWPVRFIERAHPEDSLIRASLQTSNKLLGLLAQADMTGRICEDKASQQEALRAAEYFLTYAKELGCLETPFSFPNARSKMHYLANGGKSHHTTELFDKTTFEVTMMSGIPCSGKDHWLEKNYSHPVISRDAIRKELKYPDEGYVLQEMQDRIKKALAKKQPFAINATNLRRELRAGYASLISDYGGQTHMVYLQADKPAIIKRLAARGATQQPKDAVPLSAIVKLAQHAEPPTAVECHRLTLLDTNPPKKQPRLHPEIQL